MPLSSPRPAAFPFDVDLIDLILSTIPDIHSLQSFILCSKFVYKVFDARRTSILRAVVSNHLGPVAAPAMRLLKVVLDVESCWNGWISPLPISELPQEEDSPLSHRRITMYEALVLASNHDVVQELEALYSWRKKDPRSTSSRLTLSESVRFQAALYRLWFFCSMHGCPAPTSSFGGSTFRLRQPEILMDLWQSQDEFLQSFETAQMIPLFEVWTFLVELATWAVKAEFLHRKRIKGYRSLKKYLLWSGPSKTLRAFQGNLANVIDHEMVPSLSTSYEQFYDVLDGAYPQEQPSMRILASPDECFLNTLKCRGCAHMSSEDFDLWSESNWSYLRGIVPPSELFKFVKADWWPPHIPPDILEEVCRHTPYSEIVGIVFEKTTSHPWKPGDWLCTDCLQEFMRENMGAVFQQQQ